MVWHERSDWTPSDYPDKPDFTRPLGVVVHYPSDLTVSADTPAVLRAIRKDHVNNRGYSDAAYNVAVDVRGHIWDVRGLSRISAANDERSDANLRYAAILFLIGRHEKPSAAMMTAGREVVRVWRSRHPGATKVRPHSDVSSDGTACPGDHLRAAITSGQLEPDGTSALRTVKEDDMPSAEEVANAVVKKLMFGDLVPNLGVDAKADPQAAFMRMVTVLSQVEDQLDRLSSVPGQIRAVQEHLVTLADQVASIEAARALSAGTTLRGAPNRDLATPPGT